MRELEEGCWEPRKVCRTQEPEVAALESANIGINVTQTKFKFRKHWRKAVGLVASGVSIGTSQPFLPAARSVACASTRLPFTLSHARQTWTPQSRHSIQQLCDSLYSSQRILLAGDQTAGRAFSRAHLPPSAQRLSQTCATVGGDRMKHNGILTSESASVQIQKTSGQRGKMESRKGF